MGQETAEAWSRSLPPGADIPGGDKGANVNKHNMQDATEEDKARKGNKSGGQKGHFPECEGSWGVTAVIRLCLWEGAMI